MEKETGKCRDPDVLYREITKEDVRKLIQIIDQRRIDRLWKKITDELKQNSSL